MRTVPAGKTTSKKLRCSQRYAAVELWHAQVRTFDASGENADIIGRNLDIERERLVSAEEKLWDRYDELARREHLANVEAVRRSNTHGGPEFMNFSDATMRRLDGASTFFGGLSGGLFAVASGGILAVAGGIVSADFMQSGGLQAITGNAHQTVMRSGTALRSEAAGNSVHDARIHGDIAETLIPVVVGGLQAGFSIANAPTASLLPAHQANGHIFRMGRTTTAPPAIGVSTSPHGLGVTAAEGGGLPSAKVLGSEKALRGALSDAGAATTDVGSLQLRKLPVGSKDRVFLGVFGGKGLKAGPVRAEVPKAGLQFLESLEARFGGRTLQGLPGKIEALKPEIGSAKEIIFNIGETGIRPGSLTAQELEFILSNPDLLRRTTFVFGGTF